VHSTVSTGIKTLISKLFYVMAVINELLCFIINKYGIATRSQLKTVLISFYDDDELISAKDILFADAAALLLDDTPRCVRRQKGDNRARLVCDDIFELLSLIDEKSLMGNLPVYVARNLDKLPTVQPDELEMLCLSRKIGEIDKRLAFIETNVTTVNADKILNKLNDISQQLVQQPSGRDKLLDMPDTGGVNGVNSDVISGPLASLQADRQEAVNIDDNKVNPSEHSGLVMPSSSWVDTVAAARDNLAEWTTVGRRKPPAVKPTVRVHGKKELLHDNTTIKTVPRKPVLAAFAGRLHPDTTAEELTKFLCAEGMKGVVCRKLKAKDGQVFSTAAFYVTCCAESEHLFYDERCWPEGVEVRDWVYKNRASAQ